MSRQGEQAAEVLEFWFVQSRPRQWFAKDPAFDALLQQRFQGLTRRALSGELDAWGTEAAGGLALVLLLDQFPRQIWHDTAMAFAGDPQALALSLKAVERGWLCTNQNSRTSLACFRSTSIRAGPARWPPCPHRGSSSPAAPPCRCFRCW